MRNIGVLFLASVLGFFSCGTPNQNEDPVYTVTIVPQQFFLQRLIGNAGTVNVMVPPGASPETYDATPRQLQQLQKSNVYFMVGKLGYEQIWKNRLQDQFPETDFIDTSEGMALIQSEHSHGDHVNASVDP
ncbi:MAG: metal ABC transporter solute-binding protein, Zn/Mn family, partial [Bacteroidota bacterium]